jgi:hypothetical protein
MHCLLKTRDVCNSMISFFQVCFALDPGNSSTDCPPLVSSSVMMSWYNDIAMRQRFGNVSATVVATATAKHCFSQADSNKVPTISR